MQSGLGAEFYVSQPIAVVPTESAAHHRGKQPPMPISMYAIALPTFQKHLSRARRDPRQGRGLRDSEKDRSVCASLGTRLYPDMFNFTRQVQGAADFAKAAGARLAGVPVPSFPDTETTIPELKRA